MIPQILLLALMCLNLGLALGKHGQPRGNVNFGGALIDAVVLTALLWWGGFFDVFSTL